MSKFFKKLNTMQSRAIGIAAKDLKRKNKTLLNMAVGTGKTETAIKLIKKMKYKKVLWLTHQTDLVEQTAERFINNGLEDTTLYTGREKDSSGQIVVSTVQTIGRKNHLLDLNKNTFDAIFVDEAHHAPANQWVEVIKYFNAKRIGLTATPYRPDGKTTTKNGTGVFDLFGEPTFKLRFKKAVDDGYLAKPISTIVLTNSVLEGFKGKQTDWLPSQLDKLYTSNDRNKTIIKYYEKIRKKVKTPKAVCFCINIQHAERMTEMFRARDIKADFVCSNSIYQTAEERANAMEKFRNTNELEVICAVNIFNEGIDIPEANIALMARPTGSNVIYQQQIGRVARSNGGKKKEFHVIDFVDNTGKKFNGYVLNNVYPNNGSTHKRIITEYITDKDPIVIEKRVSDIMARAMEFEDEQHNEYLKIKTDLSKEQVRKLLKQTTQSAKVPRGFYE